MEYRKKLGNFWPEEIYEKTFKKKLAAKDLQYHKDGYTQIKGVFLPSSAGFEDGCIEAWSTSSQTALKNVMLYTDASAVRDGQGAAAPPPIIWHVCGARALQV